MRPLLLYVASDVRKLMSAKKLSWAFKAKIIDEFVNQQQNVQMAAKQLKVSRRTVCDFLILNRYGRLFPTLTQISIKSNALTLIRKYRKSMELESKISELLKFENRNIE